jgi:anaerobic selenocysteine-containing dehydrogenase
MAKPTDDPTVGELRSWGRSVVHTACPLDCPDCCSLAVTVERGRVVKIDGSRLAPSTDGYICGKVRRFDRRIYSEDRLLFPAIQLGTKGRGSWNRITWDEALDLVAEKMRESAAKHGPESVLPFYYGGSNGLLTNELEDARMFRRFGASRLARTVCAAPTSEAARAMYGKMAGVAYEDYEAAKLIVIWGANPPASGIHLVPHIRRAQQNGARIIVVDPRRTALARQADLHLAVRPGTDLPVALSIINKFFTTGRADEGFLNEHTTGADQLRSLAAAWDFERAAAESGVSAAEIETVFEWYAGTSPAVIRSGWGQERNRNGGAATMAILALPSVAGKFGVRGGGYTMSNSASWNIKAEELVAVPQPKTRVINMNTLGRTLTELNDPPVTTLFVYNCNPAATMPDQNRVLKGLQREDLFTVVFDQVMTDSAKYANLVLPSTTFFEHYDVAKGYGAYHLQVVRPVIEPVGESRSNHEVFHELSVRLGLTERDPDDLGDTGALLDAASRMPAAARAALLDEGPSAAPAGGRPIQFVDVFPNTPDRKVHLLPVDLDSRREAYSYEPDPASAAFPLALISPASERTISSTLAEFRPGVVSLKIHPDDAQARGIAEGDEVRIFNDLGEVHCLANITPEMRPGVVSLPKGLWIKSTINGQTANALAPDTLADLGGGACFNDARVQVEVLVSFLNLVKRVNQEHVH